MAAERITDVAGVADGFYTAGEIAVVAVGVAAYQRTESLLPSALTYVSFVVAADLVVYFFEAGVGI
jgi:hypothetical protein